MMYSFKKFSSALAGGAVLAMLSVPAYALDVGANASIGGLGGRANASTGNNNGTSASASIGGLGIGNADANASLGGASGTAANATLNGPAGTAASANIGAGGTNGVGGNVNIGVGETVGAAVGIGTNPTGPTNPSGATNPALANAVANMTSVELAAYKKTCKQVLGSSAGFDANLVALCKMVQMASR